MKRKLNREFIKKHFFSFIIVPFFLLCIPAYIGVFYVTDYIGFTEGNFENEQEMKKLFIKAFVISVFSVSGLVYSWLKNKT